MKVAFALVFLFPFAVYARGPYYEAVGCFNDKPKPNRAMPDLIGYFRHDIDWTDLSKMVKKCAVTAKEKGYEMFGVQFYGECWSSRSAAKDYSKHGPSTRCIENVGTQWTNFVYKLVEVKTCFTVNCTYGEWGPWSATCGKATRKRHLKVKEVEVERPSCEGLPLECKEPETETEIRDLEPCPTAY